MKNLTTFILLVYSAALFSQSTIVLQPDAAAGKDASIFNLNALENYGDDVDFVASQWDYSGEPGTTRSLIQFDLSSLPKGEGIADARLSLYFNSESQTPGQEGNNAAYLRRLIQPWEENTVMWNMQPFYTTENEVVIPASSFPDQDYENIDVTALVRDMVNHPNTSYGFMFMLQDEQGVGKSMKFYSSDASQEFERPRLVVTTGFVSNKEAYHHDVRSRPNPFGHTIILENMEGKFDIAISDINGKTTYFRQLESNGSELVINELHHLAKGVYVIKATGPTRSYFSKAIKVD